MKYSLSKNCETLRENAVNAKPHAKIVELERARWFCSGILQEAKRNPEYENVCLTAAGMESVILNSKAVILEGELIVGCNYGLGEDPSECVDIQRNLGEISEAEANALKKQFQSALGLYRRKYPENGQLDDELAKDGAIGGAIITDNHSVIGYEQVLKLGFDGLLKKVGECEKSNGGSKWYSAIKRVCRAASAIGERYAEKAKEADLENIAEICRKVPRNPAGSFHEALQSLWFSHMINTWEDGINANSLGRLDLILYPYYRSDIDNGVLTKAQAFELICCLWIKLYRDYDVQQSCVGGCDSEGCDAANELSRLMLDATEALDFVRCLSVRFSANSDPAFLRRALEVVGHMQKGIPFFFNDDVMIPALAKKGIAMEDARGYAQIGCVETVIPGKSNPHAVSAHANLLKSVEYALKTDEYETYGQFKDAVFAWLKKIIKASYMDTAAHIPYAGFNSPKPYKSLLTQGCLESGMDFNGFGAKYDYYQMMMYGIPNLADSMAAVRELVFVQKRYSMKKLAAQLADDWPDETARLDFINRAPKFGNDIAEVDETAFEIMDAACDYLDELSEEFGYMFHAQPFTFYWMVDYGRKTGATPDGRHKGEIMAYSVSPMQGRDFSGLTALINSISQLPTKKAPGTASAIVEVAPELFGENNIQHLCDIMIAGAKAGLCNVQFNVASAETLRDAQKNPGKYRNLAVRVSGFSQKFILLDKTIQDHIIGRTKHSSI
ncbi:MAG: hypothetical protein FWG34_04620 [Oscillospiraceae bacterium]|nr:hypothetical protein [Oscillospiraceae bacterium]